jgi:hypothetical protein
MTGCRLADQQFSRRRAEGAVAGDGIDQTKIPDFWI